MGTSIILSMDLDALRGCMPRVQSNDVDKFVEVPSVAIKDVKKTVGVPMCSVPHDPAHNEDCSKKRPLDGMT